MTQTEIIHVLAELPNYTEDAGTMSATDRAWLCEFRIRFAAGEVPSVEDEERLRRLVVAWDED